MDYLDPKQVLAVSQTKTPFDRSRSGYGAKRPTSWLIRLDDKRWRRVYVMIWSNAGSAYVLRGGKAVFLGSFEPRDFKAAS